MNNTLLNEETLQEIKKLLILKLSAAILHRGKWQRIVRETCDNSVEVPEYIIKEREIVKNILNRSAAHLQIQLITDEQLREVEVKIIDHWNYAKEYARRAIKLLLIEVK